MNRFHWIHHHQQNSHHSQTYRYIIMEQIRNNNNFIILQFKRYKSRITTTKNVDKTKIWCNHHHHHYHHDQKSTNEKECHKLNKKKNHAHTHTQNKREIWLYWLSSSGNWLTRNDISSMIHRIGWIWLQIIFFSQFYNLWHHQCVCYVLSANVARFFILIIIKFCYFT